MNCQVCRANNWVTVGQAQLPTCVHCGNQVVPAPTVDVEPGPAAAERLAGDQALPSAEGLERPAAEVKSSKAAPRARAKKKKGTATRRTKKTG